MGKKNKQVKQNTSTAINKVAEKVDSIDDGLLEQLVPVTNKTTNTTTSGDIVISEENQQLESSCPAPPPALVVAPPIDYRDGDEPPGLGIRRNYDEVRVVRGTEMDGLLQRREEDETNGVAKREYHPRDCKNRKCFQPLCKMRRNIESVELTYEIPQLDMCFHNGDIQLISCSKDYVDVYGPRLWKRFDDEKVVHSNFEDEDEEGEGVESTKMKSNMNNKKSRNNRNSKKGKNNNKNKKFNGKQTQKQNNNKNGCNGAAATLRVQRGRELQEVITDEHKILTATLGGIGNDHLPFIRHGYYTPSENIIHEHEVEGGVKTYVVDTSVTRVEWEREKSKYEEDKEEVDLIPPPPPDTEKISPFFVENLVDAKLDRQFDGVQLPHSIHNKTQFSLVQAYIERLREDQSNDNFHGLNSCYEPSVKLNIDGDNVTVDEEITPRGVKRTSDNTDVFNSETDEVGLSRRDFIKIEATTVRILLKRKFYDQFETFHFGPSSSSLPVGEVLFTLNRMGFASFKVNQIAHVAEKSKLLRIIKIDVSKKFKEKLASKDIDVERVMRRPVLQGALKMEEITECTIFVTLPLYDPSHSRDGDQQGLTLPSVVQICFTDNSWLFELKHHKLMQVREANETKHELVCLKKEGLANTCETHQQQEEASENDDKTTDEISKHETNEVIIENNESSKDIEDKKCCNISGFSRSIRSLLEPSTGECKCDSTQIRRLDLPKFLTCRVTGMMDKSYGVLYCPELEDTVLFNVDQVHPGIFLNIEPNYGDRIDDIMVRKMRNKLDSLDSFRTYPEPIIGSEVKVLAFRVRVIPKRHKRKLKKMETNLTTPSTSNVADNEDETNVQQEAIVTSEEETKKSEDGPQTEEQVREASNQLLNHFRLLELNGPEFLWVAVSVFKDFNDLSYIKLPNMCEHIKFWSKHYQNERKSRESNYFLIREQLLAGEAVPSWTKMICNRNCRILNNLPLKNLRMREKRQQPHPSSTAKNNSAPTLTKSKTSGDKKNKTMKCQVYDRRDKFKSSTIHEVSVASWAPSDGKSGQPKIVVQGPTTKEQKMLAKTLLTAEVKDNNDNNNSSLNGSRWTELSPNDEPRTADTESDCHVCCKKSTERDGSEHSRQMGRCASREVTVCDCETSPVVFRTHPVLSVHEESISRFVVQYGRMLAIVYHFDQATRDGVAILNFWGRRCVFHFHYPHSTLDSVGLLDSLKPGDTIQATLKIVVSAPGGLCFESSNISAAFSIYLTHVIYWETLPHNLAVMKTICQPKLYSFNSKSRLIQVVKDIVFTDEVHKAETRLKKLSEFVRAAWHEFKHLRTFDPQVLRKSLLEKLEVMVYLQRVAFESPEIEKLKRIVGVLPNFSG